MNLHEAPLAVVYLYPEKRNNNKMYVYNHKRGVTRTRNSKDRHFLCPQL